MIRHTHYTGGGLEVEELPLLRMQMPGEWSIVPYIDSRPFCLPASDQGNHPHCAGYAVAGYIEERNWRWTRIAKQVDAVAIYKQAKRLDGDDHAGTTLTSAVEAAKDLGLLDYTTIQVIRTRQEYQFAMQAYDVVISAFDITDDWNHVDDETGRIADTNAISIGPHAVLSCWFDDEGPGCQNSWDQWGWKGFGRMTWEQFGKQFLYGVVIA